MASSLHSPSKHPCLSSEEKQQNGFDNINDLPDDVLCHILSFLPTQDAVATTILSKRWVDLWTQVLVLDFRFPSSSPVVVHPTKSSTVNFVFNVLLKSKARNTPKFTIDWDFSLELDVRYIRSWISAAARRNVQELSLNFSLEGPRVDFPGCLLACKTLVSLKLTKNIFLDVPAKIHFPRLKILKLMSVEYGNDDSLRRLFSGCPVLEDLTIARTYGIQRIVVLDINVASVKKITIVNPRCKVQIKAPLLETLDLICHGYEDCLIEDASNLAEAYIKVADIWLNEHQFFRLFKGVANVRFLSLLSPTIWLACPSMPKFPAFHNMVRLHIDCCCEHWHGLIAFLECSDNLEELVYRNVVSHRYGCNMALGGSVPKCVSMRLKTINFRDVNNQQCDWTLARYVLKNAKFLKEMKIGISFCLKKRRHLLRNLLKCPRASMACEIGFFLENSNEEIHL